MEKIIKGDITMHFDFYIPTKIIFGQGKVSRLGDIELPGKKALIITTGGSVKKFGYLDRVVVLFIEKNIGYVIFDRVHPNPTREHVMEAADIARKEACDFVVGLGGGSSIDTAKAVAVMTKCDGDLWDYAYAGTGGRQQIVDALPIVTISTTAGTGTETDPWFVITNERTGEKLDFNSEFVFPSISIIDPELMLTVPKKLTAYQGIDALFHAVECYVSTCATPMSDVFAINAIQIIARNLTQAVNDGNNIEARTNMAFAADVLAGFVQSLSGCVSLHMIGQTLGGMFPKLEHGASLIVIAVKYFEMVTKINPDRYGCIAKAMGVDIDGLSQEEAAKAFVDALKKLFADCGVGEIRMSEYGIKKEELVKAAEMAKSIGFEFDRYQMSIQETVTLLEDSYL